VKNILISEIKRLCFRGALSSYRVLIDGRHHYHSILLAVRISTTRRKLLDRIIFLIRKFYVQ